MLNIVLIILFLCYSDLFNAESDTCDLLFNEGAAPCFDGNNNQILNLSECLRHKCCWKNKLCYNKTGCAVGFFGWRCSLECKCLRGGACNQITGECESPCPNNYWGVGCLLESNCSYNDPMGANYIGTRTKTDTGQKCVYWKSQRGYSADKFPDLNFQNVANYCRNPKSNLMNPWCYTYIGTSSARKWGYCTLNQCACPHGLFGINCAYECHCQDLNERCHKFSGSCPISGCHERWKEPDCQECSDGFYGIECIQRCRCYSVDDVCDKMTGFCESGCMAGWMVNGTTGAGCQVECPNGYFGNGCENRCNCLNSADICLKDKGTCPGGCQLGYAGEDCLLQLPLMKKAPSSIMRTDTSINVNWPEWKSNIDKGTGPVRGYRVYYAVSINQSDFNNFNSNKLNHTDYKLKLSDLKWLIAINETRQRNIVIGGLEMGKEYKIRVSAIHQYGYVGLPSNVLTIQTCNRPKSGPTVLNARILPVSSPAFEDVNDLDEQWMEALVKINFDWKAPRKDVLNCISLKHYNIYTLDKKLSSSNNFVLNKTQSLNRLQFTNLNPYNNFTIGVSVVNNAGLEGPIVQYTYIGKCARVEDFEIMVMPNSTLHLTWSPPISINAPIDFYAVTYRLTKIGSCSSKLEPWSPVIDCGPLKPFELDLSELGVYATYRIKIWPQTFAGRGQAISLSRTTNPAAPPFIDNIQIISTTSTTVNIAWLMIKCHEAGGPNLTYMYEYRSTESQNFSKTLSTSSEASEFVLTGLDAFVNYTMSLFVFNGFLEGKRSYINFQTQEDLPGPPLKIAVTSKTCFQLGIIWSHPSPVKGKLIKFTIRYFPLSALNMSQEFDVNFDQFNTNVSNLHPYTLYAIQVRASTKIGDGPWSALLEDFTEESVPSEPRNLRNSSRTSNSITLQWIEPANHNGIIKFYSINCLPSKANTQITQLRDHLILPPNLEFTVSSLLPGINYICKVSASTRIGEGPAANIMLYTKPKITSNIATPIIEKINELDNSVTIKLQPVTLDYAEEAESLYRIVIEPLTNKQFKRDADIDKMPCNLHNSQLLDYYSANKLALRCYIAAEIPRVHNDQLFTVGDNRTYGGYYNAELKSNSNYVIWYGMALSLDGMIVNSYSYVNIARGFITSDVDENINKEFSDIVSNMNSSRAGAAIGAGIACSLIFLLAIAILSVIFCKRYKHRRRESSVGFSQYVKSQKRLLPEGSEMDDTLQIPERKHEAFNSKHNPHNPIKIDDLFAYVAMQRKKIILEFEEFENSTKYRNEIGNKKENKFRNRYFNVIAYDHSRVILNSESGVDYINANYIDGYKKTKRYIAAQGPIKSTVNDFWKMVWQVDCPAIVMTTNLFEDQRNKCEQYWPNSEETTYDDITVKICDVIEYLDYKIRKFSLKKDNEVKEVHQFHYISWPDHGAPSTSLPILDFRKSIRTYTDTLNRGPTIVHCSAGVGRTGTYIAIDSLLDCGHFEKLVNVYLFVEQMRSNRINMVQSAEQYLFIYETLAEAFKHPPIPSSEFLNTYKQLLEIDYLTDKPHLFKQYMFISEDINSRPFLFQNERYDLTKLNETAAYLGYKDCLSYVLSSHLNIEDIYSFITKYNCKLLVCLNSCHSFFKDSLLYNLEIKSSNICKLNLLTEEILITNTSTISSSNTNTFTKISFLNMNSVTLDQSNIEDRLLSVQSILNILEIVDQINLPIDSTILVYSRLKTQTALFFAASYVIDVLRAERYIDIFNIVKMIKKDKYYFSYEEYKIIFDVVREYLANFETYSNFN